MPRSRAQSISLPAPIQGWNARDSLAAMDPRDAVYLTNWWPSQTSVNVRNGYSNFATGLPGQVETLMGYAGAADKLFAISTGKIYDVSASGAVGAAVVTGLANSRSQYVNVSTVGGAFLLSVNGADKLRGYNGTAWWTDGDGTHDITGLDTATCVQINLFKNRVWFVQNNSLNVYYLPTSAIAGAATVFPLQGVARLGGYVVAAATWTIDAGYGMDDNLVFVTSKGEIIVYAGTDPTLPSTWSLIGVWQLGAPVGRRCFQKYGGDVILISQDGLVPLAAGLQSSRLDPRVTLTNKIQYAVSNAVTIYGGNFGWDITYFAKANMLLLNVPVFEGSMQQQFVMNTITQAWANFTAWAANCFTIWKDNLYFGGNLIVGNAWNTQADAGANIAANAKQAFNYCSSPTQIKRFTMIRPYIVTNGGTPGLQAAVNTDFDDSDPYQTANLNPTPNTGGVWTATWGQFLWGPSTVVQKNWQGVVGIGYSVAPRLKAITNGLTTQWMATDLVFEQGAIL